VNEEANLLKRATTFGLRQAAASLLEVDPAFTISSWIARGGQKNTKLLAEGLRKAGLPE
jgi:adenylate cyclase